VLLAVDSDSQVLAALERSLTRRFKADYRTASAVGEGASAMQRVHHYLDTS
jgi:hypothetical protein